METQTINDELKTTGYYPLRPMQSWLVDTHFYKAKSTMMNIGTFYKFPAGVDLQRLISAINGTLENNDIFHCRFVFHPETCELCQHFDGAINPVIFEKISDEEFEQRKKTLKHPYKLLNQPLYRIYILETPTAQYLYLDFYHAIMDGMTISLLFGTESKMRYSGREIKHKSLSYADYVLEEINNPPENLIEGKDFFAAMLKNFDETKHLPPPSLPTNVKPFELNSLSMKIDNINKNFFSQKICDENIFFLAASMLTIAKTTGAKSSIMSWLHSGRYTPAESRIMGNMIEQFPIAWNFENDLTVAEFFNGLAEKINISFRYRRSLGEIYKSGLQDECATFIFQKKIYSASIEGKEFETIELPQNEWSAAENSLDIEINLSFDEIYSLFLECDASRYSENDMEKFAATFNETVLQLQDENKLISEILN